LPGGANLYDELEEHGLNGRVQNKTMLKCAKNHGNWFRHFEDISRNVTLKCSGLLFWPTLYTFLSIPEHMKSYLTNSLSTFPL